MNATWSLVDRRRRPFDYALLESVFVPSKGDEILDWLERATHWRLVETDFYQQYEFHLRDAEIAEQARLLWDAEFLGELADSMSDLFRVRLSRDVGVIAHRLVTGQKIGIHNDVIPNGESHRLTVNLNRGLKDEDGGMFMLFNSEDPADVHRILRPIHNTALAFAISERSNHAVSLQRSSVRHTLVFSFREASAG